MWGLKTAKYKSTHLYHRNRYCCKPFKYTIGECVITKLQKLPKSIKNGKLKSPSEFLWPDYCVNMVIYDIILTDYDR